MKRYRFPLESALRWRSHLRDLEEAALERLRGELDALRAGRAGLEAEWADAAGALLRPGGRAEAADLAALDQFRRHVERQKRILAGRLEDCRLRIASQRQRVIEARRRAELLDKLKDQGSASWRSEMERAERLESSDLYLARWPRPARAEKRPRSG